MPAESDKAKKMLSAYVVGTEPYTGGVSRVIDFTGDPGELFFLRKGDILTTPDCSVILREGRPYTRQEIREILEAAPRD